MRVAVNRAPAVTLWAAVVAVRLGFDRDEALTLGRVVAGLNAYAKGKSLGLFKSAPEDVPWLTGCFVAERNAAHPDAYCELAGDGEQRLMQQRWPGNGVHGSGERPAERDDSGLHGRPGYVRAGCL